MPIYKDDVGIVVQVNMQKDITDATSISLIVEEPDGTIVTWTPTIYLTKYLRYTTTTNDLDQNGVYKIQPRLTLGDWTGSGTICQIVVQDKVE